MVPPITYTLACQGLVSAISMACSNLKSTGPLSVVDPLTSEDIFTLEVPLTSEDILTLEVPLTSEYPLTAEKLPYC